MQAAAQHYYNKNASDLTTEEAASLIAIVQYPDTRNLSTPEKYEGNKARRDVILKSMYAEGFIDKPTEEASLAADVASYVVLTPPTQGCAAVTAEGAQYFCDFVKKNIKNFAVLGDSAESRQATWDTGGLQVYTTLNLDLTANAKQQLDSYTPASETRLKLGSAVNSVEAGTGRVVVMTQNTTFSEVDNGERTETSVNFSTDKEYGGSIGFQPGSTYKPFTLIDWIEQGHGINEYVNARPRTFYLTAGGDQLEGWAPKNDAGERPGSMSVTNATANSVNTAYAAMASQLDLNDIRDVAERLGVHRADGNGELKNYASSILGTTDEIAPLTMATAYAGIASGGKYCAPIVVDNIVDADGNALGGQPQDCTQAIDPDVAATAAKAMSKLWYSGTAVGGLPYDGYEEIGKTGTTDEKDQIWIIGATTKLATAVWQGNWDGKKISLRAYGSPIEGSNYAYKRAALFRSVQTVNNTVYPGDDFPEPTTTFQRARSVSVPDVAGSDTDSARTLLDGVSLYYSDGGTQPSSRPAGQVIGSSPAAGASVPRGSTVEVYTSDGSGAATVPDVSGQTAEEAASALTGAGFSADKVTVSGYTVGDGKNRCRVAGTDPAAGTSVAKDAAVGLTLYGNPQGADPGNCR